MKPRILALLLLLLLTFVFCAAAFAQEHSADMVGEVADPGIGIGLKYIAAAIAVGLSALATGIAQSRIGAAGVGAIVEKPDSIGTVIILLAIPETMVILGFVVAAMIMIL